MLFGEGVVLRVLSKTAVLMTLDQLGMPEWVVWRWDKLIDRPHGILLVTGPTGSGKSTTLYASLNKHRQRRDQGDHRRGPGRVSRPGVNQIQVNHKVGLDFAAGLRAILRHDPDVVMIGEIRDKETAETAIQASLTGHLVFSTLHTNDAAGRHTRLLDMGVEPFLVSRRSRGSWPSGWCDGSARRAQRPSARARGYPRTVRASARGDAGAGGRLPGSAANGLPRAGRHLRTPGTGRGHARPDHAPHGIDDTCRSSAVTIHVNTIGIRQRFSDLRPS
jgi:hypothetical protein